ncbi:MAG: hypothetical protein ACK5MK_06865 [Dysgonomonas sp.]
MKEESKIKVEAESIPDEEGQQQDQLPQNKKERGEEHEKKVKGAVREQVDNVGESSKNIIVFFFKEFYNLILFFIKYFKNKQKKTEDE